MGLSFGFNFLNRIGLTSKRPVVDFGKEVVKASNELRSRENEMYIHEVDTTRLDGWGDDNKLFSGLRKTQSGYDLITYDTEHKVYRYFEVPSLDKGDLIRGEDGRVRITDSFLDGECAQPAVFYAPEVDPENIEFKKEYYDKIEPVHERVKAKHLDRNQKHYTLHRADISDLPEDFMSSVNIATDTEVWTNGWLYYVIDRKNNEEDKYRVDYYIPTRRAHGGFIPGPLKDLFDWRRVKHNVGEDIHYQRAIDVMQNHFQGVDELQAGLKYERGLRTVFENAVEHEGKIDVILQEEHKFCDTGLKSAWYKARRGMRYPIENPYVTGGAALAGAFMYYFTGKPEAAVATSVFVEVFAHPTIKAMTYGARQVMGYVGEPRWYRGGNCSDVFNTGNLKKNKTNPDPRTFDPGDNIVLNFDERYIPDNSVIAPMDFNPVSLKTHIMSHGSQGVPCPHSEHWSKGKVELRIFADGLVRLKMDLDDGSAIYLARYRSDAVKRSYFDMDQHFKEQLHDGISIVRKMSKIDKGVKKGCSSIQRNVSLEASIELVKQLLESNQYDMTEAQQGHFLSNIEAYLRVPNYAYLDYMQEQDRTSVAYLSGDMQKPPSSSVVI